MSSRKFASFWSALSETQRYWAETENCWWK